MPALAGAHQFERCEHVLHRVAQPVVRAPGDLEIAFYVVEREPALGPLQPERQPHDVGGPFVSHR